MEPVKSLLSGMMFSNFFIVLHVATALTRAFPSLFVSESILHLEIPMFERPKRSGLFRFKKCLPKVTLSDNGVLPCFATGSTLRENAGFCLRLLPMLLARSFHHFEMVRAAGFLFRKEAVKKSFRIHRIFVRFHSCVSPPIACCFGHLRFVGVSIGCPDLHGRFRQQLVECPKIWHEIRKTACYQIFTVIFEPLSTDGMRSGFPSWEVGPKNLIFHSSHGSDLILRG